MLDFFWCFLCFLIIFWLGGTCFLSVVLVYMGGFRGFKGYLNTGLFVWSGEGYFGGGEGVWLVGSIFIVWFVFVCCMLELIV